MLRMVGVSKTYDAGDAAVHALQSISLDLAPGTMTAIMGPSGCGKSTLLSIAGGLLHPDSGTVEVAGQELTGLAEKQLYRHRRRHIGFVFQDYNLVPMLTALDNVALPAELDGRPRSASLAEARDALAALGLVDQADRLPSTLSGGQQQRVALARALMGTQRLILADEPTGALDSVNSEHVMDAMETMAQRGSTLLVATHDPDVAARASRVLRMQDGQFLPVSGLATR
ncbi:ABC transporter ATP-binding protein [Luteococcus sp. Sow4_B9]|uniref:ABC transporter ATP-binding protein n=1 Tax=Luteococcus sp. Sow4_B9 TaxID=3438792 RepID=UPI003F95C182